jgi:hypothetical protein
MSASSSPQLLYRIDECGDVMADACVCGEDGDLVFLSVWARDTAIQQFLARLTLGRDEDGLDQFHLITDQGGSVPVFVPSVERLEKRLTRSYRRTLFGSLVNLWLFDRRCIRPDKATTSALALLPRAAADPTSRLWLLVKETCPLPLLITGKGRCWHCCETATCSATCRRPSGRCVDFVWGWTCQRSPKRWAA